jgi:hypothetical protein
MSYPKIVTINDYCHGTDSSTGPSNASLIPDLDIFTVTKAGHVKLKLQALNDVLSRTPPEQHVELRLDDVFQDISPRTYVNGSEEVYFLVKSLSRPEMIPGLFVAAYSEALKSLHFTNILVRPHGRRGYAPTFSSIRHLLPALDVLCDTSLATFFQKADERGRSSTPLV